MNTFKSSATPPTGPRDSGEAQDIHDSSSHSPPTHQDSALSSSLGSSRSHSSFSSRNYAGTPRSRRHQSNESTPVFDEAGASTRNYGATETPNSSSATSGPTNNGKQSAPVSNNGGNGGNCSCSHQHDQQDEPHQSRYSRLINRIGALELENKGSVARDHLALERTFLAWMRTSLAFASIGIAVTQLFRLNSAAFTAFGLDVTSPGHPNILPPQFSSSSVQVTSASSRLRSVGKPLGCTFIGVAIIILIIGFHRYFESQHWIVRGKFPASRGSIALTAFLAVSLIVAALAVILAVSPGAIEA